MTTPAEVEKLLHDHGPHVLSALVRRHAGFGGCEDAVQEALLAAAVQWPREGVPDNPRGWLTTVAARRWTELSRNSTSRRHREETAAVLSSVEPLSGVDDTLTVLELCCHPSLTKASQVALALRTVGGLTTAEIARAYLVPESAVAQRISRAKKRIKADGAEWRIPPPDEHLIRQAAVMEVLYLIFNEGYAVRSGSALNRVELTSEAIRLTRRLHARLPDDGEVTGLLALMLLTDARRPARLDPTGNLVPLAEQDRSRWDTRAIAEGVALISAALVHALIGPFQLRAAIAAVHDEATRAGDTDWRQILGLYDLLRVLAPGPMVTLNRIVAIAMVHGPRAGLDHLTAAEDDAVLAQHHRTPAVRAHLLESAGDRRAAHVQYRLAADRSLSLLEQRYLRSRAARLAGASLVSPTAPSTSWRA